MIDFSVTQIGDCTLYRGDCMELMQGMNPVDHIICDPPYEAEAHRDIRRTQKSIKTGINASIGFDKMTDELRNYLAEWGTNYTKGWCLYFCQAEAVGTWRDSIESFGGKYKRACAYIKVDSSPQFNGQMPAQGYETIVCQWSGSGVSKWNGGGKRGVFSHLTNSSSREGTHPTEKPLSLMCELIELFTNKDDMILDPTMGSGSTGVACVMKGRRFIGIEKDKDFYDLAVRRIQKAYDLPLLQPLTQGELL